MQEYVIQPEYLKNIDEWLFNQEALQEYILACCQHAGGGLRDKPGKNPDHYHTSYTLSGLSIAQHSSDAEDIVGLKSNLVEEICPLFNINTEALTKAKAYFYQ